MGNRERRFSAKVTARDFSVEAAEFSIRYPFTTENLCRAPQVRLSIPS